MATLRCAFCAELATSPEHLWPHWLAKLYRQSGRARRYRFHMLGSDGYVATKRAQTLNYKPQTVCRDCNNGWMSTAEKFASRTLPAAILDGDSLAIDVATQSQLAFWAAKNAIVLDHTHLVEEARGKPFLSPADRFAMRLHHQIPRNVLILVSRYSGQAFTFARGAYSYATPHTTVPEFKNRRIYSATFAYGQFVIQVVVFRRIRNTGRPRDLLVEPIPRHQHHWTRVWPSPGQTVSWPVSLGLDNGDLWDFAHQWVAEVPPVPMPAQRRA